MANVDLNSLFQFISHQVELPNNTYSWAPTRQNVLWIYVENVLWIVKNWRENALISLRGIDKTQFPCISKFYFMFWATNISREMLYLRLKLFFKSFCTSFLRSKTWEQIGLFRGEHVPGSRLRAILKWASLASKKWTTGKKKFGLFVNLFRLHFLNRRKITTSHLKIKIGTWTYVEMWRIFA